MLLEAVRCWRRHVAGGGMLLEAVRCRRRYSPLPIGIFNKLDTPTREVLVSMSFIQYYCPLLILVLLPFPYLGGPYHDTIAYKASTLSTI
jgi:hypothetical protein